MTKRKANRSSASQRRSTPASSMPATSPSADRRLTNALIMGAVASLIILGAIFLPDWLKEQSEAAEADNDNAEPTESAAIPDPLFPDESAAVVTSFTLTNAETNDTLAATLDTDTLAWSIDESPTDPEPDQVVDTSRIEQAVFSLPTMTPTRELDAIQALTQYGLDNPVFLLEFATTAGETHEIEIGAQNPGGAAYYIRVDGRDTIYLMPSYIFDPLIDMFTTPPYAVPTPTLEPTEPAES